MNICLNPLPRAPKGLALGLVCALALLLARPAHAQTLAQTDIPGPAGSGSFGAHVVTLANGNFVVTDPGYDAPGGAADVGAVSLYDGGTLVLISRLTGSQANDQVGSGGVVALTDGNFVVLSANWANGVLPKAGAATRVDGTQGLTGTVTTANSLVGGHADDAVGQPYDTNASGAVALPGGGFVVLSVAWNGGAGAATFVAGGVSTTGIVSVTNSLVGVDPLDKVGSHGVAPLGPNRFVLNSPFWNNARGAVTYVDATVNASGVVSDSNSLVGPNPESAVGLGGVVTLSNGNYVVNSPHWDMGDPTDDRGAVTWVDGSVGMTGVVSTTNSLVGPLAGAQVGLAGITPLPNGDYVIASPNWGFGPLDTRGAVTWANGMLAASGIVTATNSWIGPDAQHGIASGGVVALTNGNYVIHSTAWDGNRGAATWVNPTIAQTGVVSTSNSIVGAFAGDGVGAHVVALTNGNYAIASPGWSSGAGAVTWRDGASATSGVITTTNSLVGNAGDNLGFEVIALSNGNYVFTAPGWQSGRGAVAWVDGATVMTGTVSAQNAIIDAPAAPTPSLFPYALSNGNYVFKSTGFSNHGAIAAGAVTLVNGSRLVTGTVSAGNSVLGTSASGSLSMTSAWDDPRQQLVVGRPADNMVTVAWQAWPLAVNKSGTGMGAVAGIPFGECAIRCTADVRVGSAVTLTAAPAISSTFAGWSGDCSGAGVCALTMDAAHAVTATFVLKTYTLTTQIAGTGVGTIGGLPADPAAIAYGTPITLTALPAASSTFVGWSGDCTGVGACVLTMTRSLSVTAAFDFRDVNVVAPAPQPGGSVQVKVVRAGVADAQPVAVMVEPDTGPAAAAGYPYGTILLFTALPNRGYSFAQWGGLPNATQNPQQITLTAPLTVTAQFAVTPVYLPMIVKPRK